MSGPSRTPATPSASAALTNDQLARRSRREQRLIPSAGHAVGLVMVLATYLLLPHVLDNLWATVAVQAGILCIGGLGLNLLTGYAGQASLGHAAFISIGVFAASYVGRSAAYGGKGQPFLAYLVVAIIAGAVVGFVVGLPALRLRGPYLVIVTLGLVYATSYALTQWVTVSGGSVGAFTPVSTQIGTFNFQTMSVGRDQGLVYLVWGFAAVTGLVVKNIVRSRPGRALQAIRDRDVAAEVVGISLFRYKVGAFVVSSAIAAAAGVFYSTTAARFTADTQNFGLALSVSFLAAIIVGGIGTVYGTAIGAIIIAALPTVVTEYGANIPGVSDHLVTIFSGMIVAAVLVVTLITQPAGIAGSIQRLKSRNLRRVPESAAS